LIQNVGTPTVLAIGHSTRTWIAFLELLRAHRVERVIDVRSIPRSRHNPQFNQKTLRTKLRAARIGYVHLRKLGALRRARHDSSNMGWRNSSFRGFADYMQTSEFDAGLQRLDQVSWAKTERTDVRGSGALALPPLPHRGCSYCARNPCRGPHEQDAFPGALTDFFWAGATQSCHISY
jgi:hypothetical protein